VEKNAAIAAYGLYIDLFTVLLVGSHFTGIYMPAQDFIASPQRTRHPTISNPKRFHTSWRGGLLSAILGPSSTNLWTAPVVPFLAPGRCGVESGRMFLFLALDLPS
jgi:hypothetical protein